MPIWPKYEDLLAAPASSIAQDERPESVIFFAALTSEEKKHLHIVTQTMTLIPVARGDAKFTQPAMSTVLMILPKAWSPSTVEHQTQK